MIRFENVSVTYPGESQPALQAVDLTVPEGEFSLVVGPTGSGKSTLLGAATGRVPHTSGGLLAGRVLVAGRDTRKNAPRDLADVVGVVGQNPIAGFVTDRVEDELAFGMEQLGIAPSLMRKRVEEVIDLLGLAPLRSRPLADLSGGEQQRVAIGSVLTVQPRVLVLDEPTSALDPGAAEDVLAALARLVHDVGMTVLLAEHRLERVVQFADQIVSLTGDGVVDSGTPARMMATSLVAPPVVQLGRLAGWNPLPLSVREGRRSSKQLRETLATVVPPVVQAPGTATPGPDIPTSDAPALTARGITVRHGMTVAVDHVDLALNAGEISALMGRNGSGKSSLLWALQGQGARAAGTVALADGTDPARLATAQARRRVTLVPQDPADLLYLPTVGQELNAAGAAPGASARAAREVLDDLAPGIPDERHPRDLSEGQRLALALAVQLCTDPLVVLLDEPTRGLDYAAKDRLSAFLQRMRKKGTSVLLATHDVEFVARCAGRVVLLADGQLVATGAATTMLQDSPMFAPQVAKIMRPLPLFTTDDVTAALAHLPEGHDSGSQVEGHAEEAGQTC